MKVRISGNSIRFRLKQSEVKRFAQTGEIRETIAFGGGEAGKLSFVLVAAATENFQVSFHAGVVTVQVPQSVGAEWTATDLVGVTDNIDIGKGETIKVLVEKDFKCIDGSDQENEDAYPNPNMAC